MKHTFLFAFAALAALSVRAQSLAYDETYRQAVQGALDEARVALAASALPADEPIAILPVADDEDGWILGSLKIALTQAGKRCVEGKEDPLWAEILKEVEWDERKADMLDASTLDRFGRLQSARILVSAFVRARRRTERYAFFEIELHASEIATKRHLWGGVFAKRQYVPGIEELGGAVDLPQELRETMQGELREKLIRSLAAANAFAARRVRVAFLPLAADDKGYALGIVRDALGATPLMPVNLDLRTLAEARLQLRDKPDCADAILYGSLRDLSTRIVSTTPRSVTREYCAEIQLVVESAAREQLWSDTILAKGMYTRSLGLWDTLCHFYPVLRERPHLIVTVPLIAILLIGFIIVKTRPR